MISPVSGGRTPHVAAPLGPVVGRVRDTPDGPVFAYLGVPFGMVTERFMRSARPRYRNDPLDADQLGPIAMQSSTAEHPAHRMSETECLTVNVWNGAPGETNLPVFVWIHGGLHISGSNGQPLQRGDRLAAFGRMIVVSVNYRLGALGNLSLGPLLGDAFADADNLALLDVIDALRWVKDSIAEFGGDPGNVTLSGQSAGGVLVACALASPESSGLIRRAIIQSANIDRPTEPDTSVTDEMLAELGCTHSPKDILTTPGSRIIAAQESVIARRSRGRRVPPAVFRPAVDGRHLICSPAEAIARGASAGVDLIVGTNANEATSFVDVTQPDTEDLRGELRACLQRSARVTSGLDLVAAYREALSLDSGSLPSIAEALERHLSDELYRNPSHGLLRSRRTARAATYGYGFVWADADHDWARRSGHSLEVPFIFRHIDDSPEALAELGDHAPSRLRDDLSYRWAAFAATGVPGDDWPTFGPDQISRRFG